MVARWVQQVAAGTAGATAALPAALASDPRLADVPRPVLEAVVEAAATAPCPIDYRWLVGVSKTETDHGRVQGATITADGRSLRPDGRPITSPAGAEGITQFMPATAREHGLDDPADVRASFRATAAKLCADGIETQPDEAIGAYNGGGLWRNYPESRAYVLSVRQVRDGLPEVDVRSGATSPAGRDRRLVPLVERVWDRAVVRPWLWVGGVMGDTPEGAVLWGRLDSAAFPGGPAVPSERAARIVAAADAWVGRDFRPGVREQCAVFVRQVLADAGVELAPEVTGRSLDQWAAGGPAAANSFGGDQGDVIRTAAELAPGDLVLFRNTYGPWEHGAITHVAIYVGDGQIVDRPTMSSPVLRRPLATFGDLFVAGIRLR